MKIKMMLMVGVAGLLFSGRGSRSQTAPVDAGAYVDENQPDPAPLKLRELEGSVRGLGGDGMPGAAVSLFSDDGHALVATVVSDKDGKFRFDKVGKGAYRIVVKVQGLCPANVPVVLEGSLFAHRKVVVTMRPKDIDTCSYGMAK
ncbi:MAG TPA: carboxypeptidase-like regulatory domain-containing protein [Acidobacteriaceae bacterium]|nr:carboxypeptidase-like regulatory domain-containing protein [Acidobacteriaceae bacterium]